jgi:hypothetical protein
MKVERLALFLLLGLTAGCSDPETATPEVGGRSSTQELVDEIRSVPVDDRDSTSAANGRDIFARLEQCEVDDTMEARIRAVVEELELLLLRYTERHPDVVALTQRRDDLVETALTDCVERLQ